MKTKCLILLCAITLGLGNLSISRATDDDIATITDVALVRPGCLVASLIGSAIFLVALPVAAASGSVHHTADTLVWTPVHATFTRPLGDFTSLQ